MKFALNNPMFSDITFHCGSTILYAHQILLKCSGNAALDQLITQKQKNFLFIDVQEEEKKEIKHIAIKVTVDPNIDVDVSYL